MLSDGFEAIRVQGERYVQGSSSSSHGVVLTATISPPPGSVARADPNQRIKDYEEALRFYLTLPARFVDRILFIDNSGTNLSPLVSVVRSVNHDKLVELISFCGNDHPVSYGKAYGEFKLIDFGLTKTSLFAETDLFWKVTGRLRCLNLAEMIKAAPHRFELLCDLHNVPLIGTGKLRHNNYMDLRIFCCSKRGYDKIFRGCTEVLRHGFDSADIYDLVWSTRARLELVPRFPIQPKLAGYSGRHNRLYESGIQAVKTQIRAMLRHVAPWLWI